MPIRTPTRIRLIGLALTAAVSGLALASAGSASAQVYEWSPQKTATRLTGTLTFIPTDDNGPQFQCKVVLNFRTGNVKRGADALPEIISATTKGKGCETVQFLDLPWDVGATTPGTGTITRFGWSAATEGCEDLDGAGFLSMPDGTWTFVGACLEGTLTSNPPVTIVPRP
jgi:hypothetical protein